MKKLILLSATALLVLVTTSCKKEDANTANTGIIGTWKCIGFGSAETTEIDLIEPADCEKCYTITFNKDGTFEGKSLFNTLHGKYKVNNRNFEVVNLEGSEVGEEGDALVFTESLQKISKYKIIDDQLYLYYLTDNHLLLNSKNE